MKDLIVLTADRQQEQTVLTLLKERVKALGIHPVSFDIYHHPEKDSGVFKGGAEFLRPQLNLYRYALVILDSEWEGALAPSEITAQLMNELTLCGWDPERVSVIVIEPELEIWFWIRDSVHVAEVLKTNWETIYRVGRQEGFWPENQAKPARPKELLETLIRAQKIPRSASLYVELAEKVSFRRCEDPAFQKTLSVLQNWFSTSG